VSELLRWALLHLRNQTTTPSSSAGWKQPNKRLLHLASLAAGGWVLGTSQDAGGSQPITPKMDDEIELQIVNAMTCKILRGKNRKGVRIGFGRLILKCEAQDLESQNFPLNLLKGSQIGK